MSDDRRPRSEQDLEVPAPRRSTSDDALPKIVKPTDGPQEIVDAAAQESEIPADETDEG